MQTDPTQGNDDRPPIFANWKQVYFFLLVFQAVLMLAFYWFMHVFS